MMVSPSVGVLLNTQIRNELPSDKQLTKVTLISLAVHIAVILSCCPSSVRQISKRLRTFSRRAFLHSLGHLKLSRSRRDGVLEAQVLPRQTFSVAMSQAPTSSLTSPSLSPCLRNQRQASPQKLKLHQNLSHHLHLQRHSPPLST